MPAVSQRNLILFIVALILTLSAAAVRAADETTTLTITGISGSIPVQSFNISCAENGTLTATIKVGAAAVALTAMVQDAKRIQSMTLAEGPADHPTIKYQFTNALIASMQTAGNQATPEETVEFKFDKCSIAYQSTMPGGPTGPVKVK